MKTIVVANSRWVNIGNAFYTNAIVENLREAYAGQANILAGEEAPTHAESRWNGKKKCFFDYSVYTEADWFVISGPRLNFQIRDKFEALFAALQGRGTRIVILSAGGLQYSKEEVRFCQRFLQDYPPYILSTRDSQTYENYGHLANYSYDGICSAFYASRYFSGYDTPQLGNYIAFGFDTSTEPQIHIDPDLAVERGLMDAITVDDSSVRQLSSKGLLFDNLREYPNAFQDWKLIRPMHRPTAKFGVFAYNRPNKFVSLNPYAYLNLYRNTDITISQRVHACVVTLSYQKPAILVKKTKRSLLFDRLGLSDITKRPVVLNKEIIDTEKQAFINFLRSVPV